MDIYRVVRFGLVGLANTAIYYGLYITLKMFLPYFAAHVIAFALSVIGSYFLNCYFTFRTKPSWKTFLLFPLSTVSNFVIQSGGLWLLVEVANWNKTIAPLAAAVIAIPITFFVTQLIFQGKTLGGIFPAQKPLPSPKKATT